MTFTFQHVDRVPSPGGGNTEIIGRGIRVYTIHGLHEAGESAEEIAESYDLPLGAVYEALAYAVDHPEEMDAIRQADAAVDREMMSRLPEEVRRGADPDLP